MLYLGFYGFGPWKPKHIFALCCEVVKIITIIDIPVLYYKIEPKHFWLRNEIIIINSLQGMFSVQNHTIIHNSYALCSIPNPNIEPFSISCIMNGRLQPFNLQENDPISSGSTCRRLSEMLKCFICKFLNWRLFSLFHPLQYIICFPDIFTTCV